MPTSHDFLALRVIIAAPVIGKDPHTFGRRLRAAEVSFEDRQDLLGHRSNRITTHYSSAELHNLYEAGNKVCEKQQSGVVLTLLRNPNNRKERGTSHGHKVVSL